MGENEKKGKRDLAARGFTPRRETPHSERRRDFLVARIFNTPYIISSKRPPIFFFIPKAHAHII